MANLITVGRVLILFGAIAMIYSREYAAVILAGVIIALVFAADGLDGWVARRRGSTSKLGAVLDIAGDRVVENVLWVVFAELHLIGVWVPLVVLTRSFTVDVIRSAALSEGKTPFGESTMMRSRFTTWLTAGRFTRSLYGWSKAVSFVFLTWLYAWREIDSDGALLGSMFDYQGVRACGWLAVYASVALCVIRGLPVLYDARYYLRDEQPAQSPRAPTRDLPPGLSVERHEHGEPA